jgi:hypothetical protein
VKDEKVLYGDKEERNILHIIRRGRLIGLATTCVGIGPMEVVGRRRGRCEELLDDFTETRGCLKLITEALDGFLWTAHCGRGY